MQHGFEGKPLFRPQSCMASDEVEAADLSAAEQSMDFSDKIADMLLQSGQNLGVAGRLKGRDLRQDRRAERSRDLIHALAERCGGMGDDASLFEQIQGLTERIPSPVSACGRL
jgi:hypothetical protein